MVHGEEMKGLGLLLVPKTAVDGYNVACLVFLTSVAVLIVFCLLPPTPTLMGFLRSEEMLVDFSQVVVGFGHGHKNKIDDASRPC